MKKVVFTRKFPFNGDFFDKILAKTRKNDRIYSDLSEIIAFKRNEKFEKNYVFWLEFVFWIDYFFNNL